MKTYLKIKRAIRYIFYKHISVDDQLKVKQQFNNDDLTRLFWQLSMQDRHHSIEVLERTISKTIDDEILTLKELESLNDLYTLCLLHDIGKSVSNFSWIFRIFSELKIIKNKKSKLYLNHEQIGLEYMKKLSIDDSTLKYYQKELIDNKHFVLDKTDY
tara:strand:- start:329 stop:802 length:474 start_codon:yes stop_codon:yes gene_type:complete